MLKSAVLTHFGSVSAVAAVLDITVQAVHQWGETVPEVSAYKLESLTDGALKVNPAIYKLLKAAGKGRSAGRTAA